MSLCDPRYGYHVNIAREVAPTVLRENLGRWGSDEGSPEIMKTTDRVLVPKARRRDVRP